MLITLVSWLWIGLSSFLWGYAFLDFLNKNCEYKQNNFFISTIYGLCILTVFAQYFSLFYKVSTLAQIIVLVINLLILFKYKNIVHDIYIYIYVYKLRFNKQDIVKILVALFVAIILIKISSSPVVHYDSPLYHEQSIRWIEDYGVVKGLGNIHTRLAYNSSLFSLQALFSLRFLFGQSLHSVNGFFGFVFITYSILSIKAFKHKKIFPSDFLRLCIIWYYYKNYYYISSPETDVPSLSMFLFIIVQWLSLEEDNIKEIEPYANICLLCLYNISMKVSVGMIVLLAIKPTIALLKEKRWKTISKYVLVGIFVILPFILRNIILSGYVLYPFPELDFFNFDWKMHRAVAEYERNEIKVWAWTGDGSISPYDADMPLSKWYPIWANNYLYKPSRIAMFYGSVLSMVIMLVSDTVKTIKDKKPNNLILTVTLIACFLLWFFGAPHYRYGRTIMTAPFLVFIGRSFSFLFNRFKYSYLVFIGVSLCLLFTYLKPIVGFQLEKDYYIYPADYELVRVEKYYINGIAFYCPIDSDQAGYYAFPSSPVRVDYIVFRGEGLKDGFLP